MGQKQSTEPFNIDLQNVFNDIYRQAKWSQEGNRSGQGSSVDATKETRDIIKRVITKYNIRSLVDVSCGAMAWMPILLNELNPGFIFAGLDITPSVIENNKIVFRNIPNWRFAVFDITTDIPPSGYDLILCRDTLMHLSYNLVIDSLENFSKSNAKYILLTSYENGTNKNIGTGQHFTINLLKEPFLLPKPLEAFPEKKDNKVLLLYSISQLRRINYNEMRKRALPEPYSQ